MIPRKLAHRLTELASYYPVVAVTGPRQSGKTTLCQATFPEKAYVSLESLDTREFAREDPRGFLAEVSDGAIIDEIQHRPELLSYLQSDVDARSESGRFIVTGSQHFGLSQSISQSLAGRCGMLLLLPPTLEELRAFPTPPDDLFTLLWQGAYPRIYDRNIPPRQWLADYVATYLQRDVRQLINVGDLQTFSSFLKLCAGRTAQEINLSALANDAGLSHNTIRAWLSVLETSYIIHRLPGWHKTLRKQLVKTPKLHFFDSGLVCYLLGIAEADQLRHHPLRGAIFETWATAEIYKNYVNSGLLPALFHYRQSRGLKIDLLVEEDQHLNAIEFKSGATANTDFLKNLQRFAQLPAITSRVTTVKQTLVYGGDTTQQRSQAKVVSWRDIGSVSTTANK